jgi:uncharacterized Zn finger protein (UPF0148 family)
MHEECDHPADAIMWNPWNLVIQCHRCGQIIEALGQPIKTSASDDAGSRQPPRANEAVPVSLGGRYVRPPTTDNPLAEYPPCPHCGSTLRPGASTCPVCGPHAHGRPEESYEEKLDRHSSESRYDPLRDAARRVIAQWDAEDNLERQDLSEDFFAAMSYLRHALMSVRRGGDEANP